MGYTRRQRLSRVELPLAVPLMIAGLRLATVTTIGLGDGGLDHRRHVRRASASSSPRASRRSSRRSTCSARAVDRCSRSPPTSCSSALERRVTPWTRMPAGGRLMDDRRLVPRPGQLQRDPGIPTGSSSTSRSAALALVTATRHRACRSACTSATRVAGPNLAINVANIGRAVPSYALVVIILPISLRVRPGTGLDLIPTFIAMVAAGDPADPGQRLRGAPGGGPRPRRGRPRDGLAGAPDPARPRGAARARRSSSADSGPRRSRSSRRRRSGRSSAAAGSAGSSSTASTTRQPAALRRRDPRRRAGDRGRPHLRPRPAPDHPARPARRHVGPARGHRRIPTAAAGVHLTTALRPVPDGSISRAPC